MLIRFDPSTGDEVMEMRIHAPIHSPQEHRPDPAQAIQWLASRLGWERTLDSLRRNEPEEPVARAA